MCVESRHPQAPVFFYFRFVIFRKFEKVPFLAKFRILWGTNVSIESVCGLTPEGSEGPLSQQFLKSKIYCQVKKLLGGTKTNHFYGPTVQKFAGG